MRGHEEAGEFGQLDMGSGLSNCETVRGGWRSGSSGAGRAGEEERSMMWGSAPATPPPGSPLPASSQPGSPQLTTPSKMTQRQAILQHTTPPHATPPQRRTRRGRAIIPSAPDFNRDFGSRGMIPSYMSLGG